MGRHKNHILSLSPWGSKSFFKDREGCSSGMLTANADEGPLRCISAFYCGNYYRGGGPVMAITLASGASACDAAKSHV